MPILPRALMPMGVGGGASARELDNTGGLSYDAKEARFILFGDFTAIGFILFLAFLLFGPKKLPEIARTLGKAMAELRRASNELRSSLEEEIINLDRPMEEPPAPAPKYGYDYSEPTHEEPEPRP